VLTCLVSGLNTTVIPDGLLANLTVATATAPIFLTASNVSTTNAAGSSVLTLASGGTILPAIAPGAGLMAAVVNGQSGVAINSAFTATLGQLHANPSVCVSTQNVPAYACKLPNRALNADYSAYQAGMIFLLVPDVACPTSC